MAEVLALSFVCRSRRPGFLARVLHSRSHACGWCQGFTARRVFLAVEGTAKDGARLSLSRSRVWVALSGPGIALPEPIWGGTWADRPAGALLGEDDEGTRTLIGLRRPGKTGGTGLPQVGV